MGTVTCKLRCLLRATPLGRGNANDDSDSSEEPQQEPATQQRDAAVELGIRAAAADLREAFLAAAEFREAEELRQLLVSVPPKPPPPPKGPPDGIGREPKPAPPVPKGSPDAIPKNSAQPMLAAPPKNAHAPQKASAPTPELQAPPTKAAPFSSESSCWDADIDWREQQRQYEAWTEAQRWMETRDMEQAESDAREAPYNEQ